MDSDYNERLTDPEEEKLITIHEFGHLYNPGLVRNLDHYGVDETEERNRRYDTDDFSNDCTYGRNATCLSQFAICTDCQKWIRSS